MICPGDSGTSERGTFSAALSPPRMFWPMISAPAFELGETCEMRNTEKVKCVAYLGFKGAGSKEHLRSPKQTNSIQASLKNASFLMHLTCFLYVSISHCQIHLAHLVRNTVDPKIQI